MSKIYKLSAHIITTSLLALCLASCMAGGTMGTGLSYRSGDTKTNVEQVSISGVILNTRGKAAKGYTIVGQTAKNQEISKADLLGSFSMTLSIMRAGDITFTVRSEDGKVWRGSFPAKSVIDGDEFSVHLNSDGTALIKLF